LINDYAATITAADLDVPDDQVQQALATLAVEQVRQEAQVQMSLHGMREQTGRSGRHP
jgi:hypothetical protein